MFDISKKIDELAACKPARRKGRRRRALSLHEEVLSLVQNANAQVAQERHVTPRSALTVMKRSLSSLSSLDEESRRIGVLREVNRFISLQHDTQRAHVENTEHADLLPMGHPLSSLNAYQDSNDVRRSYATWLAADSSVPSHLKVLVSSAFASQPFSLERKHAFTRLNLSKDVTVPLFFKIDPIVAAFAGGNSSAARRARVALQWRDKKGRWVEMGRGANFRFRLPNGDIASASGVYVGVSSPRPGAANQRPSGLIQVSNDANLPDGIYAVQADNVDTYAARLTPEELKRAGVTPGATPDQGALNVPSQDEIVATRLDAPTGWTKQKDGSFTSDDNYTVKGEDGEFTLYRQNEDGSLSDKVGEAANWGEINDLANSDQEAYDAVKGQQGNAEDQQRIKARLETRTKYNEEFDRLENLAKTGTDINGNKVPQGWNAVVRKGAMPEVERRAIGGDREFGEEGLPYLEYSRTIADDNGNPVDVSAMFMRDGKFYANDKEYDSWEAAEADIPNWIADEEEKRGRKLSPVSVEPKKEEKESLIPDNVGASGELPNGVTYTAEDKQVQVAVFPGRYAPVDGVRVALAGDTYPNRENIKKLGFRWNNADKIWYKNFIDSDLLGSSFNTTRIREQLDGIGGGAMPRYAGDNVEIESVIQDARNKMIDHYRATAPEQQDRAKEVADILYEAGRELGNRVAKVIPNNNEDRIKARTKLKEFLDTVETDDLFQSSDVERAKERTRDAITLLDEKIGDTSDNEKPPAVAKEDKPAQKVVSNSPLSAPVLFDEFDAPRGAFQLRTIEYEAEGRIDQESSDYTDDPDRLATKYPLPELVRALTEAMIGEKEDSILSDILDASIGDDDESLDLEELNDVADTPAPQAGRANGTGAGSLEFNAGSEFIPAEALYNAVFKAGGDPNRVIANAYDAVHGDRRNLEKLTQASGDLPSPEEQQLVDDIMQEIRQIKDATPDGESPVSNAVSEPDEEPLPGKILNNIPIDWDNPDYYVLDPNQYVPTVPEPDENGYSDNPEFLARYYETADLIQQLETAIADGSGSTYLYFGNEDTAYMEGVFEVPVEAIRDALQLQDVNTNTLLENIKNEANNMEEPEVEAQAPTPEAAETPQEPTAEVSMDNAIKAMRDFYSEGVLRRDIKPLMYLPRDGSIAFKDSWDDLTIALPDGSIRPLNVTEEWLRDPNGAGQAGWRELTEEEKRNIIGAPQAAPAQPEPTPATEEPTPQPEAPRFQYPGPRESGYSPNNTTMVRGGAIVGRGSRVVATKDGKTGTVVAIQNDPEYLRIRFDDGTTAVRAAAKVKALSDPSGAAPTAAAPAEEQKPAQGIETRLDRPKAQAPRVARSGDTVGVNDESTMPQWLNGLTNDAATQADFAAWGSRDAEIAKAARERISLDNLETQLTKIYTDRVSGTPEERRAADRLLTEIMGDIYGARNGITFGGEFFSVTATSASISASLGDENYGAVSPVDAQEGKLSYTVSVNMDIRDATGNKVGDIRRILSIKKKLDENKNVVSTDVSAKNEYLAISGGGKKKKGFATAFNRYSENWYIANGASSVKVYAAGGGQYQGGFVWALNGFNWDPSYGRPGVNIGDFQREMKNRDEEAQVEYLKEKIAKAKKPNGDIDYATYPTPLEFALVGWYPGAKDWIGKRVMVRNSWNGIKVLKPEAREQVQAANYTQIKNAERRIESKQNIPNLSSNAQTLVESDPFRNNSIIAPYFGEIRDALKNNRSLAVLSPDAKNALNAYVSEQILDKNRSLSLEDAFRLRNGLGNEYRADYGYSDPFNSAEVLSTFTTEDFIKASKQEEYTDLNAAGFTVRQLGFNEGGVNSTFEVTHVASGQVFFVKNEEFAARFSNVPGGVTELEAITLLRAAGMQGIHDVRIGRDDKNLVIMSRAGSTIPLVKEAINAGDAFRRGLKDAEGKINVDLSNPSELMKALDTPEDIVRMSLFDIIGNNQDRHNGNWMMAYDKVTGKIRVFPVDNTIGFLEIEQDRSAILEYLEYGNFNEADVYSSAMPQLISALGTDGLIKMYDNEIKNIISNLDNPLYQPKGFEMDAIIAKWGSYDAFKDAMAKRLQTLTTQGTDEYNAFKAALRLGYWS